MVTIVHLTPLSNNIVAIRVCKDLCLDQLCLMWKKHVRSRSEHVRRPTCVRVRVILIPTHTTEFQLRVQCFYSNSTDTMAILIPIRFQHFNFNSDSIDTILIPPTFIFRFYFQSRYGDYSDSN